MPPDLKDKLIAALRECDRCSKYGDLISTFDRSVRPIVERALQEPLRRSVRDHVSPDECCPQIAELRELLCSDTCLGDDVWFLTFRCAAFFLERQERKRTRDNDARSLTALVTNCFVLFCKRKIPDLQDMALRWSFLRKEKSRYEASDEYVHCKASERRKLLLSSVLSVFSERAHKSFFTTVWTRCVEHAGEAALHVHLLHCLGSVVIPGLTNPVVLADYLSGCFGSGGLISVLALQGLFILMVDHGLEYPGFYEQLYSLITADAFASRHRYDLFRLLAVSMKSLRVPSYVAASVVKKVARVALTSPTPTVHFALPFVRKLLQTHPNCLALIHRSSREAVVPDDIANDTGVSLAGKKEAAEETAALFEGKDPFDPKAKLASSHALHSTLWELTALEKHFLPAIPLMVSAFSSTAEDGADLRFEKTYGRLFTSEVTRPLSKEHLPTVAYKGPGEESVNDSVLV